MAILPYELQPLPLTGFPRTVRPLPGFRHCLPRSQESFLDSQSYKSRTNFLKFKCFELLSQEYAKDMSFLHSEINYMLSKSRSKL